MRVRVGLMGLATALGAALGVAQTSVNTIQVDALFQYNFQSGSPNVMKGDTEANAVCNDGVNYVALGDTENFGYVASSSLSISKFISNASPINGQMVNAVNGDPGTYAGYGTFTQTCCADGFNWKQNTLICLPAQAGGDVLLMGVVRQNNVSGSAFFHTFGGLVKSYDHGAKWTNFLHPANAGVASGDPPNPYNSDMFAGSNANGMFSTLLFVLWSNGGSVIPATDNQDVYVYAVAGGVNPTTGTSAQYLGSAAYLLRVARAQIENLSGADWQVYTGGDGMLPGSWSSTLTAGTPIYQNGGAVGQAQMQCGIPNVPGCLMIESFYNAGTSITNDSRWHWLTAPHPWGPWTVVRVDSWPTYGLYLPYVQQSSIANGPVITVLASGNYMTNGSCTIGNSPSCLYSMFFMHATLSYQAPAPAVSVTGPLRP